MVRERKAKSVDIKNGSLTITETIEPADSSKKPKTTKRIIQLPVEPPEGIELTGKASMGHKVTYSEDYQSVSLDIHISLPCEPNPESVRKILDVEFNLLKKHFDEKMPRLRKYADVLKAGGY